MRRSACAIVLMLLCMKVLQLRWHPDKFRQKYGKLLIPAEQEAVDAKVSATFQMIMSTCATFGAAQARR